MWGQWFGQWLSSWFGGGNTPEVFTPTAFDYIVTMATGRLIVEPQTFEKRQGNSLWVKVRCRRWADIDPTWTNFTGTWELNDSTGATLFTGSVTRSATEGTMFVKITPAQTLTLAVGSYTLVTEINNTTQSYTEERQDVFNIFDTSSI